MLHAARLIDGCCAAPLVAGQPAHRAGDHDVTPRADANSNLRVHASAALVAFLLMSFALWNGYAIFFNDSRSYVRGGMTVVDTLVGHRTAPEWKARGEIVAAKAPASAPAAPPPPTANRSVYYGLLAFIGYLTSNFWLTILLQAYAVGFVIALVARRVYRVPGWWPVVAVVAPLALLTTVGPFVAYVMPDIFTGVIILAAALVLIWWPRLTRGDRIGLFAVISFGLLAHNSHVVIIAALLAMAAPILWWPRDRSLRAPLGFLLACVVVALVGVAAFDAAARRVSGQKPLLLPHLTAHLIDMGPGMTLIRDRCPEIGYAVCDFADHLPVDWVAFLGSTDPQRGVFEIADPATKRRLSDEQISFALAVARHDPAGLAAGMARDIAAQLGVFNLRTMRHDDKVAANMAASFPPAVAQAAAASRVGQSDSPLAIIETSNLALTIGALLYLALVVARSRRGDEVSRDLAMFMLVVVLGLVANAIVCGGIASPNPRFQARVIWLLPFLALAHFGWDRFARRDAAP
jgi:hypothetical protein